MVASHHSIWTEGVAPSPHLAGTLSGAMETEIAIIGGGVAGLSIALHLARLGYAPIVLEADRIGLAATGMSAGVIAPQMVRNSIDAIHARLGPDAARRMLEMVARAGDYVFELARDCAPDCDAEQSGFVAPVASRAGFAKLVQMAEDWRAYRSDVSTLSAETTAEMTGVGGYAGALLDRSGGMLNPLVYARGLARSVTAAGGRIHENTPALGMIRNGCGWTIQTPEGSLVARRVVLCANLANAGLHRSLQGTTLPLVVCEVATGPINTELRSRILPGRQSLTDVEADVFSIRYHQNGGLVTAYPAGANVSDEIVTQAINARLAAAISNWEPLPLTHIWRGTASINSSLLPRLAKIDDGLIAVQACNGRGLAINSILGRDLAEWLHAGQRTAPPLPLERPQRISGFFLAKHAPKLIMTLALAGKRLRQHYDARFSSR